MNNEAKALLNKPSISLLLKGWAYQYLGILCLSSFLFADFYFVSSLGFKALVAISILSPFVLLLITLFLRIGTANTVVVAQDAAAAKSKHPGTAIFLMVLITAGLSALWLPFQSEIRLWLGAALPTWQLVEDYLKVAFWGFLGLAALTATLSHLRGLGQHNIIFKAMAVLALTNLLLDPLFIFGLGPIAAKGIAGAAVASNIAIWTAFFYVMIQGQKSLLPGKPDLVTLKKILFLGTPLALMSALVPLRDFLAIQNGGTLGPEALSALGVGQRIDLGIQLFFFALVSVITPQITFSNSKGLKEDLRNTLSFSIKFSLLYVLLMVITLTAFSNKIVELLTEDIAVQSYAQYFLHVVPWSYLLFSLMYIGNAWLTALGETKKVALIGAMTMLVQITSLQFLSATFEFHGIVWSYLITSISSVCLVAYFLKPAFDKLR